MEKKMRFFGKKSGQSLAVPGKGSTFALAFGNEVLTDTPGAQKNGSLTDWKTSNKAAVSCAGRGQGGSPVGLGTG